MSGPKLDVIATVREAYGGAWTHLGEMLRLIWLPGLLYLSLSYIPARLFLALGMMASIVVVFAASLILWSIIAVAWHRYILMGDLPPGRFHLKFGRRESRFLMVSIAVGLLVIPGFLLMLFTMAVHLKQATVFSASVFILLSLLLLAVGLFFAARLSPLLPASAVDDPVNARFVLRATQGNSWRIAAAFACVLVPAFVSQSFAGALIGKLPDLKLAVTLIATLINIFFAIVDVAILSVVYRELVGPQAPSTDDEDF